MQHIGRKQGHLLRVPFHDDLRQHGLGHVLAGLTVSDLDRLSALTIASISLSDTYLLVLRA